MIHALVLARHEWLAARASATAGPAGDTAAGADGEREREPDAEAAAAAAAEAARLAADRRAFLRSLTA